MATSDDVGLDPDRAARVIFGRNVRDLRRAQGISQEQLAQVMADAGFSMHQVTVGKLETGRRPTPVEEVHALATVFGVALADLLDLDTPDRLRQQQYVAECTRKMQRLDTELADLDARREQLAAERTEVQRQRDALLGETATPDDQTATPDDETDTKTEPERGRQT